MADTLLRTSKAFHFKSKSEYYSIQLNPFGHNALTVVCILLTTNKQSLLSTLFFCNHLLYAFPLEFKNKQCWQFYKDARMTKIVVAPQFCCRCVLMSTFFDPILVQWQMETYLNIVVFRQCLLLSSVQNYIC